MSKKCVIPTIASPNVMIVNSSNLSTRCGKLMILLLKFPCMKNGRNAPVITAITFIHIIMFVKFRNVHIKAIMYIVHTTDRLVIEFPAAPFNDFSFIAGIVYNVSTVSSIISMDIMNGRLIFSQFVDMVFVM